MPVPVVIVEYNPRWPAMYEEERQSILTATGDLIVAIEHIGSTAVPGLGAKPIIDIMAAVRELVDAERCVEPLKTIGYEYVPEYNDIIPERRYFRKGRPEGRTHHLHMVEWTSDFWRTHLLFRDHLRAHPEEAEEYYRLKRELSTKYGADREGYAETKTSFIESVVARAQAEQAKGA
ncbi:MAG: GrpB family protein [Anaerolineae bacterium]|nr:GrpB family protein [Anaerolineae bacterium]NIN99772.1 GrpB family protein [Anaerolineae bacterium]NIQ82594.1 GrpB family protein [Anaerolineae bacterium]